MEIPSVYKGLRLLMVLCYYTGQFAVVCVTVERSDLLRYHSLSKSLIGLLLEVGVFSILQLWDFSTRNNKYLFVTFKALHYITVLIKVNSMFIWFYLGSRNIVYAFHAIDRMRETMALFPSDTVQRRRNLRSHMSYFVAIFICLLTMVYALSVAIISENSGVCVVIIMLLFGNAVLLQTVTIISLYYSCSLVVEDCCQTFFGHRTESLPSFIDLKDFYQLTIDQFVVLKEATEALGKHVLVILLLRVSGLVHRILYSAEKGNPEATYIISIVWWTSLLFPLFFSVNLISSKMDRLTLEVLSSDLTRHGKSKREAARVKMLMTQLQTRPKFTAAGFVEITPELFLSLLSLDIDYLILLWQNKTSIRNVMSSNNLITSANSQ